MDVPVRQILLLSVTMSAPLAEGQTIPRPIDEPTNGAAWYNPHDGRVWVSVNKVEGWSIIASGDSPTDELFLGPDNAVDLGILPVVGQFAGHDARTISEDALFLFTYGPVDLGRVALPGLERDDFFFSVFDAGLFRHEMPVFQVPEPSTLVLIAELPLVLTLWTMFSRRSQRGIGMLGGHVRGDAWDK